MNKDVSALSLSQLVALYNQHADRPVKAFKDRATALRRVTALMATKGVQETSAGAGLARLRGAGDAAEKLRQQTLADQRKATEDARDVKRIMSKGQANQGRDRAKPANASETPPTKGATKRGARATYADDAKITVVAGENPCRKGTGHRDRFDKYRTGMTVAGYVKAVESKDFPRTRALGDINYDVAQGWIKVA